MPLFESKAPGIMALLMRDFPPLSVDDAAAPLGNLGEESGGFVLLQEQDPIGGGAGGFGWAQWTGPRRTQYLAYCSRNKLDPKSDRANYGFLFTELKGDYARALAKVRAAFGLDAKVAAFMNTFEMPNAKYAHLDARIAYAKRAIAAYQAAPKPIAPLFTVPAVADPAPDPAPTTTSPPPTMTPAPAPAPVTPPPVTAPGTPQGKGFMFNIMTILGIISKAPTIIESGLTLIDELNAGYQKAKADPKADLLTYIEDMMQALVAHKGSVASAILGNEPHVAANGTIIKK